MKVKLLGEMRAVGEWHVVSGHVVKVQQYSDGYRARISAVGRVCRLPKWESQAYTRPRAAAQALESWIRNIYFAARYLDERVRPK